MWVYKRYIDASSAQVTAPGLNGGFSFRGLKKLKGGDSWIHSTAQRKEHSKTEFGRKNPEIHPKTLMEIAMVLSTNSGFFPSNSHVSATFSILLRFGEPWNPTNFERLNTDGSLMGKTNLDKSVW